MKISGYSEPRNNHNFKLDISGPIFLKKLK